MNTENTQAAQKPDERAAKIREFSAQPVWQAARKRAAATGGAEALEVLNRKIALQDQLLAAGAIDPEDFFYRPLRPDRLQTIER